MSQHVSPPDPSDGSESSAMEAVPAPVGDGGRSSSSRFPLAWLGVVGVALSGFVILGAWTLSDPSWMHIDRPGGAGVSGGASGAAFGAASGGDVDQARRETEDLQQRVMQAMNSRQPLDLLPQARALVERHPRFAPAHTLLGQMLLQRDRYAESYQSLDMSLRLDSQQPHVHQLAGTIAQAVGRHDDAVRHFSQAVGQEPDNVQFRLFLAQAYTQTQQFDAARMTLLHALRMRQGVHEAYYLLSVLDARQGQLAQAITQSQRAIDHLPAEGQGPLEQYARWQAKLLQRDNRPAEAVSVLAKLPATVRFAPAVLEDLAVAWQMLGQPAKGAAAFEDALGHRPGQWDLAAGAAKWYAIAGDTAAARRMIAAAHRIDPHRTPPEATPEASPESVPESAAKTAPAASPASDAR